MFADHILRKTKFFHDSLLLYTNLSSFLLWLYVFFFAPSLFSFGPPLSRLSPTPALLFFVYRPFGKQDKKHNCILSNVK